MSQSLLFIPDISGFTKFVQSTEAEHSQHVIAELLELLINANTQELQLAEIEGDALFFFKENEIPSQEKLLAQIETMYTAFYSHLELLKHNRICPCNACASAPELQLKIIAHSGELQFLQVQNNRKPFGQSVIEAHRLLKNSVESDNYVLLSKSLSQQIVIPDDYNSKLFQFRTGSDFYDEQDVAYLYSEIETDNLKLQPVDTVETVEFDSPPGLVLEYDFDTSGPKLLEYLSNYKYRQGWAEGVDRIEFNSNEVTRIGTEHMCVINKTKIDFTTVTKAAKPGQIVYGELTTTPPIVDEFYQFYIIDPISEDKCHLTIEMYWTASNALKRWLINIFGKKKFKSGTDGGMQGLKEFIRQTN